MSLQVWLPFTDGTLKQQGLKNVSATIGGTVGLTDAGKLGKCATFSTTGSGITLPASTMTSFTECSVAFWINITAWNTSWDTIFQAGLSSTPWNNYIFGILRNQSNYLCFTVSNGSSTSSGSYVSSNLTVGQWIHLAFTYGNGKCKIYINGALDKEYSTSITPNFAGITNIAIGRSTNGSNYQSNCKLNDFRIYDHCLSSMEIKQISQGLILHYSLNRNSWGQENLFKTSPFSGGARWTSIKDGRGVKIDWTSNAGDTYFYFDLGTGVTLTQGNTYTLSFQCSGIGSSVVSFYWCNLSGNSSMRCQLKNGLNVLTFQMPSNNITKPFFDDIERDTSLNNLQMWDFKLEEGSIATPWCPNSSDAFATTISLNGTIEYDTSGYCNNGTRIGTFSWTSDTPKYQVSMAIEKGIVTSTNSFITTADPVFSVALWFKLKSDVTYTAYTDLISFSSSSYSNQPFRLEICGSPVGKSIMWFRGPSGQSGGFAVKSDLSFDTWYHTVLVSEGNKQYSYYVNGEKLGTYNGSANSWTPTGNVSLGENISGVIYESDFRIYATALSASDVQSLYQNSAYIDSSGNVYGAVHSEA